MSFKFEMDKNELKEILSSVDEDMANLREVLTLQLGADLAGLIRNRVGKGIGSDDAQMKSPSKNSIGTYSSEYASYRESRGRNTDIRDLSMTGRMMGGITVAGPFVSDGVTYVNITFAGGPEIMARATYNETMSPFFGISPRDNETLNQALTLYVEDFLTNEGEGKNDSKPRRR